VLNGQAMDRFPVAVPYIMLLQTDHWCELTGQPAWTYWDWLHQDPAEHVVVYADFCRQLPFDIFQPQWAPTRQERENWEVVHQDGKHYSRDHRTGDLALLKEDLPHAFGGPNQTQYVHDQADADRHLRIRSATERLESGRYDFMCEARRAYPDIFIMNGVIGTFYQCTWAVGETRLFSMLYDEPELIHYMSKRILEDTLEDIRALAAAGCDAIYIDDAMTTRDMISRDFYERFSMPYVRPISSSARAAPSPHSLRWRVYNAISRWGASWALLCDEGDRSSLRGVRHRSSALWRDRGLATMEARRR